MKRRIYAPHSPLRDDEALRQRYRDILHVGAVTRFAVIVAAFTTGLSIYLTQPPTLGGSILRAIGGISFLVAFLVGWGDWGIQRFMQEDPTRIPRFMRAWSQDLDTFDADLRSFVKAETPERHRAKWAVEIQLGGFALLRASPRIFLSTVAVLIALALLARMLN